MDIPMLKMNFQSQSSMGKGDWKRVHDTRKQVVRCEAIIRKVLAIHNCLKELQPFESDHTIAPSNPIPFLNEQKPLPFHQDEEKQTQNQRAFLKPASSHIATPLFSRSKGNTSVPVISTVKPTSSHIPTPIPSHKQSLSPIPRKRSCSASESSHYSPTIDRQNLRDQFSEASFHTPTKRYHQTERVGLYGQSLVEEEQSKHIQWIDTLGQRPLVQRTPPLSKPLHRQLLALKPCVDSPDGYTKRRLEEQRMAMIEKQRVLYTQQLDKKKARLF